MFRWGCESSVYKLLSGKSLEDVIRFLYLEHVWQVCPCYTGVRVGRLFAAECK